MNDKHAPPASVWRLRIEAAFWLALPLIGLALFLFRNTQESLWADEAYTMGASRFNPLWIWQTAAKENHQPLYFLILWAFQSLAGPSLWVARSVSALGAFCMLLIGAFPLRRALGRKTAILFILMTMCAPGLLAYAQNIRNYTWAAFFVTGMGVYLYLAIRDGQRGDWILTFLLTVAAMYTHPFSLMAAAYLGIFGLAYVLRWARARWLPYLVVFGAAGLLFVPWFYVLLDRVQSVSEKYWIPPVTWLTIRQAFAFPYGLKFDDPPGAIWIAAAVTAVLLSGLAYALRRRQEAAPAVLFLLTYLAVFATAVGFSLSVKPILIGRYMLPVAGLWIAAAAYALAQFRREITVAAMIALFLASASSLASVYQNRYNGPMEEVADYLSQQLQPGDIILHTDEHTVVTFAYYFPDNTQVMFLPPESNIYMDVTVFPNIEVITDLESIIVRGKRIWLATRPGGLNDDALNMIVSRLRLWAPESIFNNKQDLAEYRSAARYFYVPHSWYAVYIAHTP